MRRAVIPLVLLSTVALAHGGGHLKGVVTALGDKQLTVTAEDGDEVLVALDKATRFENDGKPASAKALSVGARVVVHMQAERKPPVAALVKFIAAPVPKGVRLDVSVTKDGFVVANPAPLKAGQPVTLVVTRKVTKTCATDIVLKEFGISQPIPLDKAVEVTFTPKKPGKVHFACAMDMVSGDLKVE